MSVADPTLYDLTTRAELERVWSRTGVDLRLDDDGTGDDQTDSLQDVIDEASQTIYLYLENWYEPSDLRASKIVRRWANKVGCYFLSKRRGDPGQYEDEYQRVLAILERIQAGQLQVPGLANRGNMCPSLSNYRIDDHFTTSKVRVQPATQVGGTYDRQDNDPQWLGYDNLFRLVGGLIALIGGMIT